MAIISVELGANPAYVALLQLSRLLIVYIFMLPFFKKAVSKLAGSASRAPGTAPGISIAANETAAPLPEKAKRFLLTLLAACLIGLPLRILGVPAGTIIGAMIGSAGFNTVTGKAYFPLSARIILLIAGARS